MLAAPSLIHASAACLSSDAYNHTGMNTLPIRVGLGASKFVRRAPAWRIQTDGALRRADDGRVSHWRRETLAMMMSAALVVDRRAKADFGADRDFLQLAVVVAHGQRDIDPVADFQRPGESGQPEVIVTGRQGNLGFARQRQAGGGSGVGGAQRYPQRGFRT